MLTFYIIFTTIMNLFFGIIWQKKDMVNLSLKIIYFTMAFIGAYLIINNQVFG